MPSAQPCSAEWQTQLKSQHSMSKQEGRRLSSDKQTMQRLRAAAETAECKLTSSARLLQLFVDITG